ncbi:MULTISPECIES: serine/threonine-protein kinase PknK [Sorangium]|uniref:Protein kinase n=1 Tax=Sorangium cellulosum TaxID=56 RepID=A0A4P2QTW8_SORCE|nr:MULTISPECIES: serine/threonine-protein kinase [Sorangium]AUX33501.1 protein kinase [Sorangium cellulosum]WCQ92817.1 serine-threonine kinase [Sorangium sp. Soce836]
MVGGPLIERGARIGEYTIDEPLGEGGFGAVFRGHDESGNVAAIKIFKEVSAQNVGQLFAQQNEIEALLRLRHPSLVKLSSYGVLDGIGLYLAMELVQGETLDRYLARMGSLDTIEALRIARRVAEALAHCHALNVLHLDLKPSNIVLTDPYEPRLKILDFGLATLTVSFQPEHARVNAGTIAYLAPECLKRGGLARPSPRMDLYAVGVVLYELLAGRLPFADGTVDSVINQKVYGTLVPLATVAPETPAPVVALVDELMQRDPARRFSSAARLCARLKELYYVTLHGTSQPPAADAAERERDAAPPEALDDAPFMGRELELGRLAELLQGAVCGEPRPAVVVGDTGVGKSRLVAELLRSVEQTGTAIVAYGRCRELSGLIPYSAIREALTQVALWLERHNDSRAARIRRLVSLVVADDAALLQGLVPELMRAVGLADEGGAIGPGGTRWIADLLLRLLGAIAEEIPVVLAIEDVHWADEATQDVLLRISDQLGERPILLLGTARPPFPGRGAPGSTLPPPASAGLRGSPGSSPMTPRSAGWLAWKGVERLDLGPLPPEANRALLSALGRGAGDDLVQELVRRVPLLAAGNPLFNIQVVRNMETEGFLQRGRGGALEISRADAHYRAPASVSDVLARSIEALDPTTVQVLGVAALIGRQFLRDDLVELGLFGPAEVDSALRDAAAHHICLSEDGGLTSFSHDAAREQLAARVPPGDRGEVHRRIARRIELRGGDPGTLAHHVERAGELDRAAEAYLLAANEADRLQDPHGASRRLKQALALLERLPLDPARIELRARCAHELARVACLLGSTAEPLDLLRRTQGALPDTPLVTAALSSALSRVHYVRGEFADAVAHSRKALAAIGASPELRPYQCLPANILGRALCAAGKVGPATEPLRRGCELAEAAGEYIELCHSRGILCVALSQAGCYAEAEQSAADAARLAERLRDPVRLLGTWFYYAVLAEGRFDWDLGVRSTAQLLSYAEEHGLSGLYLYVGTMYAGRHQFHVGHLARARVLIANACNLSGVLGIGMGRGWAEGYLGDVLFVQGQVREALAAYDRAIEIGSAGTGDAYAVGLGRVGRVHALALLGRDAGELRAYARETLELIRASGNRTQLVTALERCAEAFDALGEEAEARDVRAEREVLVDELGLVDPTFWPRPPAEAAFQGHPRAYWTDAPREVRSSAPSSLGTTQIVGATVAELAAAATLAITEDDLGARTHVAIPRLRHVTLLETLASVEGFVPRFDGPEAPPVAK